MKNIKPIILIAFLSWSSLLVGCKINKNNNPQCESQLKNAKTIINSKNYGAYLNIRDDFLRTCSAYGVDETLRASSINLDDAITREMETSHQYKYFVDRERIIFSQGDYKDYPAYMTKQYQLHSSQANYLKNNDKNSAIKVMIEYEKEVIGFQRELGTAHTMYYLALSYNERFMVGEDDAFFLKKFAAAVDLTPFATTEMYNNLIYLSKKRGNTVLSRHLVQQQQALKQGWGTTAEDSRLYPLDKSKLKYVADNLDEKNSPNLKQATLELAGLREKVEMNNQLFMEQQSAIQAERERTNAEYAQKRERENQLAVDSLTGLASTAVIAKSSGSNVAQAVTNSASETVMASSEDPELMQSIKRSFNNLTDSQSKECNLSTTSGFESCCRTAGGKIFTQPLPEGETSYACRNSQRGKFGCIYKGNNKTGQCGMESE